MWDPEVVTTQKARKDYHCDGSEYIFNMFADIFPELTFAEKRQVVKVEREKRMIKKGTQYVKVSGKWEGDWAVFRVRPEVEAICQKYDLYQD